MKCKICEKEFEPVYKNELCCSKECKSINKIKINKEYKTDKEKCTLNEKIVKRYGFKFIFENYEKEKFIELLVEFRDYNVKTATEKYKQIREAYMRGNDKELLSI